MKSKRGVLNWLYSQDKKFYAADISNFLGRQDKMNSDEGVILRRSENLAILPDLPFCKRKNPG
jgi:hypothetical protein